VVGLVKVEPACNLLLSEESGGPLTLRWCPFSPSPALSSPPAVPRRLSPEDEVTPPVVEEEGVPVVGLPEGIACDVLFFFCSLISVFLLNALNSSIASSLCVLFFTDSVCSNC